MQGDFHKVLMCVNDEISDDVVDDILCNVSDSPRKRRTCINPIKTRIHTDADGVNKIFTIDLMDIHEVTKILLSFNQVSKACAVRMKVQIY